MKIAYCSDLHLEFFHSKYRGTRIIDRDNPVEFNPFHTLENKEGAEVLILAGDICNIGQFLSGKDDKFWDHVTKEYTEVIWVFGNHEYYGYSLSDSLHKRVSDYIEGRWNNLYATHRGILEYNGVSFVCGTMWTDYDRGNPNAMLHVQMGLADYNQISVLDTQYYGREMLTPNHVLGEHKKTIGMFEEYLSNVLESGNNSPIVCITHHAPSLKSIMPKYLMSSINPGFASDLDYLTMLTPNLKYWIHGHMHDKMGYKLNGCQVLCNPHGYIDYENIGIFKLDYFEV